MRKVGALSFGQVVWAVPDLPAFTADAARFVKLFDTARQADWSEFLADCGKFETELAKEIRTKKFTLAELEEEEQSVRSP